MLIVTKVTTQRDIAEKLGISVMTVSRALRRLPTVRKELSAQIRQVAKELGYRPDPLVQSLMTQRVRRSTSDHGVVVAWIGPGGPKSRHRLEGAEEHLFSRYYEGASQILQASGFKIADLSDLAYGIHDPSHLGRICKARGVAGLLLGPGNDDITHLPVNNPEAFALVQIGYSRHHTAVDRVAADAYHAMRECMKHLRRAGYKRIGFFDGSSHNLRNERLWEAAYFTSQPRQSRIQPVMTKDEVPFTKKILMDYIYQKKLDAVVSGRLTVYDWLRREPKLKHIGFACPNLETPVGTVAGVNTNFERIGESAAEFLINAIHAGRRGLQSGPRTLSIAGEWHPGELVEP